MPSNFLKLSSSSMESEFHNRSDFERRGSFDSQGSHNSRTRSFNMDDENMKYLTNEEKNALMFFEETLDAFEEDNEEPPILLNSSLGCYSLRTEDSHSDSDDIIDLVQRGNNHEGLLSDTGSGPTINGQKHTQHDSRLLAVTGFASAPVVISTSAIQRVEDHFPSEPPIDYPKFHGAVPTPVILAQKISEKKTENVHLSSMSPKEEKSQELKKSVATSPVGDDHFVFPGSPNGKLNRFPNNISVKLSGKQYNKTIAKAAVNVQERKAQVLANLHGPSLFAEEIDGKNGEQLNRRTSFRDVSSEQSRYEALTKLGLVKEMPVQANMQTTSVCTSPVSNDQHSPKFFPPEIKRRFSNEKVNANSQLSAKISSPEFNTKISNEYHVINGQNSSTFFATETKRVPSIEKDNMSSQHLPKAEESKRRLSNEQMNPRVSIKVLSPESSKKISYDHDYNNGQNASTYFTTETKRVPSIEKETMSSQHLPKTEESNRRLSNEQNNPRVSIKVLSPESSKKVPYGHDYNNSQNSSKYFTAETKRVPSIEKETMSSQYLPKTEESNRRLSNEQINPRVSIKVLSPESSKKISYDHDFNNGQNSSKYFTTETKRIPSEEQDHMSGQHLPKVLGEASSRRLSNEQESISKILRNEPSPFVPLGKTVVIKGETPASYIDKNKRHSSIYVNHEQKQPNHQEIKRTSSVPRPTGFRSQGITVQFSGRDSSEETRKDALRKLGLLKGQSGQ